MPDSPVRRNLVLAICCMSILMVGLDVTILNVALPREQAGVASTTRQLGSALGVAVIGSVIAEHVAQVGPGAAFTEASRISWAIIALCGFLAMTVGGLTTGAWGRRRAEHNAELMGEGAAAG